MTLFKLILPLLAVVPVFAQAPKVTVVHTGAVACGFWNTLIPGSCRQSVVLEVENALPTDTFLVSIRYLTADGTETIESRYPVKGRTFWFYIDDITVLSATAGSSATGMVGVWYR